MGIFKFSCGILFGAFSDVLCEDLLDENGTVLPPELNPLTGKPVTCGNNFAIMYFTSFFFLCSFLVSSISQKTTLISRHFMKFVSF